MSGIWSHGRSSGCHGAGLPRIARPTQAAVAKLRWRSVSVNVHSPSTDSCNSAGSSARALSTVPSHRPETSA